MSDARPPRHADRLAGAPSPPDRQGSDDADARDELEGVIAAQLREIHGR